jgi:hypothetical protein
VDLYSLLDLRSALTTWLASSWVIARVEFLVSFFLLFFCNV